MHFSSASRNIFANDNILYAIRHFFNVMYFSLLLNASSYKCVVTPVSRFSQKKNHLMCTILYIYICVVTTHHATRTFLLSFRRTRFDLFIKLKTISSNITTNPWCKTVLIVLLMYMMLPCRGEWFSASLDWWCANCTTRGRVQPNARALSIRDN